MSEVLENGLTILVSAHISCCRMHFSDMKDQVIYDLNSLESILYSIKRPADAAALFQLYGKRFEFISEDLRYQVQSALGILENLSKRKS